MPEPIVVSDPVEVAPSEDQGNVPIEQPVTPSEPAEPATLPAEPTEPVATAEVTPELFTLPDGRQVDAATLAQEWRENFMPDYTKKSQDLAALRGNPPQPVTQPNSQPAENPLADPDYVPQTYAELEAHIAKRIFAEIEKRETDRVAAERALENEVVTQLADVKKLDPAVNENALFLHATKYAFRDLRQAYQNMKDMNLVVKQAVTTTTKNIAKRSDPVSVQPGAGGTAPSPSNFGSAVDYLRSLKK